MYQCVGCEGIVEIGQTCECGKTEVSRKGKVRGENYRKVESTPKTRKSAVRRCPSCGWKGLVAPRIGLGCPDHGVWFESEALLEG